MGNQILIYHNGHRYIIDSDLIYTPWFVGGKLRSIEISKSDTVSENNKDKDEKEIHRN
jgi:hypothetical protein